MSAGHACRGNCGATLHGQAWYCQGCRGKTAPKVQPALEALKGDRRPLDRLLARIDRDLSTDTGREMLARANARTAKQRAAMIEPKQWTGLNRRRDIEATPRALEGAA